MTLATVAIPSPLMRTTLPGVAREMPRHPVRQVMASTTGRGAAAEAAAAATGAWVGAAPATGVWVGAAPPVPAGACARAALGTRTASAIAAMATDRRAAARRRGEHAGRSTIGWPPTG